MTVHTLRARVALAALTTLLVGACSSGGATPAPTTKVGPTAIPSAPAPSAAAVPSAPASSVAIVPSAAAPSVASSASGSSACPKSAPAPLPVGQTRTVTIDTSKGQIAIKVDGSLGPNAAGNFVALAACGFYNGVVFHRLVPGFVIQGGDPTGTGTGGPGYTIKDEPVKGTYKRGTVAMARTPAPDSQGSQFFIVLDDQAGPALESYRTYAIFGSVVKGMDTVDAIAAMPNSGDQAGNQAIDPVAMTNVTVTNP